MDYNRIIVTGRCGMSPDMRYSQDGTAMTNFSVAVSGREKENGEWVEKTQWWRIQCFGKLAENANQYLDKGKRVLVEGEPKIRTYERKDGGTGVSCEIRATNVVFLSPKSSNGESTDTNTAESDEPLPF